MARRHLIIGGGTAGMNAIRTIREDEAETSEITLVSAEKPYSRMVLPYYLDRSIAESHVFTATAAVLAQWDVKTHAGRRAAALDVEASVCTLDDGTKVAYDDCLIATGSSALRAGVPGADGRNVHSFWTLDEARGLIASLRPGASVAMIGAGFISFTILNSILSHGVKLTIVELERHILPRMIDATGAALVQAWLTAHGVTIRAGARVKAIADARGGKRLTMASGGDIVADVVIMATGIRTNLEWLKGSGVTVNRGVVVDDRLRSNVANVYAAGDVAEGRDLISGQPAVHAIEPTAQEHGRVAGANMAGKDVRYRGSLIVNIVEVCDLDVASFGAWDDAGATSVTGLHKERPAYRKLLWRGDRLTGAIILGRSNDIWAGNDVGMLKGLVQTGVSLARFREHLERNPFDIKPAYIAAKTTSLLLPETVLGRASKAPGDTPVAV
ncbi:MAG: NAD(P)/FAD-dependent oxidoreductase [Candidatus Rokuibacteriota bacterium]